MSEANIDTSSARFQFAQKPLVQLSSPTFTKWQCGLCTYKNLSSESICVVCGTAKAFMNKTIAAQIDHRTRTAKEIDNHIKLLDSQAIAMQHELEKRYQERIEYEKDKEIKQYDREDNEQDSWDTEYKRSSLSSSSDRPETKMNPSLWTCNTCTLKNEIHDSQCMACQTPRSVITKIDSDYHSRYPSSPDTPSHLRNESVFSLFDGFDSNNEAERVPSKHMMNYNMVEQFGAIGNNIGNKAAFERAAIDIDTYNDNPKAIFKTLQTVISKLLRDNDKYCILDTTNPKVEQRLLGYEGVIDFLRLVGFELDSGGQKLICKNKDAKVISTALEVLDGYTRRKLNPKVVKQKHETPRGETPRGDDMDIQMLEQILLFCTHEQQRDFETMDTLIMCYKEFSTSEKLMLGLKDRFFTNVSNSAAEDENKDEKNMKPIQLAVVKILQDWMKTYWQEDFANNNEVQHILDNWLRQMSTESVKNHEYNKWAETIRAVQQRCSNNWSTISKNKPDYSSVVIPDKFTFQSLTPEELADQIIIMDFRIFSGIRPREYLGQAWKKKDKQIKSPNLLAMIQQFNDVARFVQLQILSEASPKRRGRAIKRAIDMGECFRKNRNYSSLCAIFTALSGAPIHRLELAWEKVPEKQKQQFTQFQSIFVRDFNHRNLRQLFRSAEFPAIPHIGLFLQDLVFIDEGNENKKSIDNLRQEMVNFTKLQRMADRIKTIQLYQQHPYSQIQENQVVQKMLIQEFEKIQPMTENQIWDMSTTVKEADKNYKSKKFTLFGK